MLRNENKLEKETLVNAAFRQIVILVSFDLVCYIISYIILLLQKFLTEIFYFSLISKYPM